MCELCNLEKRTKWYGENEHWAVVECDNCHVPLFVLKQHRNRITSGFLFSACDLLRELNLHGEIDFERRKIKEHFHFHVR